MHQIRSKSARLNDTIRYEESGQCGLDLSLMVRLYNHESMLNNWNESNIKHIHVNIFKRESRYFHYNIRLDDSADAIADILQTQAS
jgi:hypothetical protein